MAPEQLEGKDADARTDIFAFGAVVYEMLTGKKAFAGKSPASLIASILTADPPTIAAIQPLTPPPLNHIVKRCLAKDPDDRWQSARDLLLELKGVADSTHDSAEVATPVFRHTSRVAWDVRGHCHGRHCRSDCARSSLSPQRVQ